MKKIIFHFFLIVSLSLTFSCEKDLPQFLAIDGYEYSTIDIDGGNFVPILLNSGAEISIPSPSEPTSTEYLAEIQQVKNLIAGMNATEARQVNYWSHNPTIRWNEIALELIAKYNLIPGPNPDGTYTLPNAANPAGPPLYPFANPPYAVRALAYLSVAQYDGLISAWHHKYQYDRRAPYQYDASVKVSSFRNNIPSYPAEGAVIAYVSRRILTSMFPLEAEYLLAKEAEHLKCLLLSGTHVQSDVDAGLIIGNAIADNALARASQDGMRFAQTPRSVSDSIANAAEERFGWKWENIEIPQRPVGLVPLYGKVQMWNVPNVEDVRPGPPPAVGSPEFLEDVETLKFYAKNVTPTRRRIANFWEDGLGSYTPPGHWNRTAKEFAVKYRLNPLRTARTFAYLNMSMMDAGISCWDAKYYYHYPRPIQAIPGFKTILGTPNFPAYTSGHSVFSASGAEVLAYIFPAEATKVRDAAIEAAWSRVYGGIHWTFDATEGTKQGKNVASYTINRARSDGAD